MGWQQPSRILEIKERVRRRDGDRCVVCKIDEQTHDKRYGQILDVHRIVPGSDYSTDWGVCITLCKVCHGAVHGNGPWGWISKVGPMEEEDIAYRVRHSSIQDLREENTWRTHEAWGVWVKELRLAKMSAMIPKRKPGVPARRRKRVSLLERFARLSDLSEKALLDFEAGRREPLLSEAKKLAAALGITLDELATEKEPDDRWQALCNERSHRRALVLRAREAEEGEIDALDRGAKLVWEIVGIADEERAEAIEAAQRAEEKHQQEMLKKQPLLLGKPRPMNEGLVVRPK